MLQLGMTPVQCSKDLRCVHALLCLAAFKICFGKGNHQPTDDFILGQDKTGLGRPPFAFNKPFWRQLLATIALSFLASARVAVL